MVRISILHFAVSILQFALAVRTQDGGPVLMTFFTSGGGMPRQVKRGVRRLGAHGVLMNDFVMMQGAWDVLSLEQDGRPAPDAPLVKLIIFKDDQIWFRLFFPRSNEFGDEPAQFELDPTKNPKRIDQTVDGKTYLGI